MIKTEHIALPLYTKIIFDKIFYIYAHTRTIVGFAVVTSISPLQIYFPFPFHYVFSRIFFIIISIIIPGLKCM